MPQQVSHVESLVGPPGIIQPYSVTNGAHGMLLRCRWCNTLTFVPIMGLIRCVREIGIKPMAFSGTRTLSLVIKTDDNGLPIDALISQHNGQQIVTWSAMPKDNNRPKIGVDGGAHPFHPVTVVSPPRGLSPHWRGHCR